MTVLLRINIHIKERLLPSILSLIEVNMPRVTITYSNETPPRRLSIDVPHGISIAELLYKLGIRYDSVVIAYKGEILQDLQSFKIEHDINLELLVLADGG